IPVQVMVKDMFDAGDDAWPDRVSCAPRRGDTVQSDKGRRLSVLEVVHTTLNGNPLVLVEIGVDRNDNTATGGGGGDLL
ncbi:unnamed protein product, partial [marine sediment metagenome]